MWFGEVPDTDVPLQRIENALGHFLHFTRTEQGTLTDISATGGTRVHLHYDNPLGRLTDIKRVVDNQAVETLTQYRYYEHGQLSAVINRNGDTVRSFSYADGLMVTHSNAIGLGCHNRWETLNGKPRVVEHWTSDGEHFHFRYDFAARTSWATDVLGRELEIHYNEDHRVIASRDYGGERYAIDLDDFGNMVGLTLPDGNQLHFKYDEFARLLEETDPLGRTKLGNSMGARKGDGMANHHLIPEEILDNPQYAKMFDRLRSTGFNGDGASNGIFLPGSKGLTQKIDLPGHWSNHGKYTDVIESKVSALNKLFEAQKLSDTQLVLGIGKIQNFAREGLEANKFVVDAVTGRLL